uniref:Uncharacterized protein n=1 Tax=Prolemur simus TaxID=1328070 RepID=A0A8C9A248_PROSS
MGPPQSPSREKRVGRGEALRLRSGVGSAEGASPRACFGPSLIWSQTRRATSSGSAAASPSGRASGGAGPRPKRGGPWWGAKRRRHSAARSAASSTPPGNTCAPGKKPWLAERCSSSSRKPSAGGGDNGAAALGRVPRAASTKVAASRQPLGPGRRGPLMAVAARPGFRRGGSLWADCGAAPTPAPARPRWAGGRAASRPSGDLGCSALPGARPRPSKHRLGCPQAQLGRYRATGAVTAASRPLPFTVS